MRSIVNVPKVVFVTGEDVRIPANGAPNVLYFVNGRLEQGSQGLLKIKNPREQNLMKNPFAPPPKKNCDDANLKSHE